MHKLFVQRHASKSVYRASARREAFLSYKNAVWPQKFARYSEVVLSNVQELFPKENWTYEYFEIHFFCFPQ